ncbi:helix-turn-helix transcriptional regulator [Chamaesiphon sp. OTE_75_metabat_556]|uniref:helix-turn-helix domain-containing protein n=1 Tax=Chamaesiphon sp. OTE_75_metabat_556 TaxID=2964692 RepID=UPI00286BC295|nr:helix-turn-helix transcriptional regulator [Chamaesiphon sp. OTE_75_metabat_556]
MIQNERQYKITQTKLKELEQASTNIDRADPSLHPRQVLSQINSYEQLIKGLKQELAEYEELKSGQIKTLQLASLAELPIALIKARIAVGMTQKELAEKIGTQEQQIQRYEANHYSAISFDRLVKVAEALGISFDASVKIDIEWFKLKQILEPALVYVPELSIEQLKAKLEQIYQNSDDLYFEYNIGEFLKEARSGIKDDSRSLALVRGELGDNSEQDLQVLAAEMAERLQDLWGKLA